jgi:hypothetical protein
MIRLVLVGEDHGSIAKRKVASEQLQLGGFYESMYFHRTLGDIVCRYLFIVIFGQEVQYGGD